MALFFNITGKFYRNSEMTKRPANQITFLISIAMLFYLVYNTLEKNGAYADYAKENPAIALGAGIAAVLWTAFAFFRFRECTRMIAITFIGDDAGTRMIVRDQKGVTIPMPASGRAGIVVVPNPITKKPRTYLRYIIQAPQGEPLVLDEEIPENSPQTSPALPFFSDESVPESRHFTAVNPYPGTVAGMVGMVQVHMAGSLQ